MHMQPIYRAGNPFAAVEGSGIGHINTYIKGSEIDIGVVILHGGFCLWNDNKMIPEQKDVIIELIRR